MTVTVHYSSEALVRHFLSAAPLAFAFIAQSSGYRSETILRQISSQGLESVTPDQIASWFWAVWRFDTDRLTGEVRFGDREHYVSVVAAPAGASLEFALWEWSELAQPPAPTASGGCETIERLQRELERQASILHDLSDRIVANSSTDLTLLRRARDERQDAWTASHRDDQHARARAQADEAFRAGDFIRVLQLLAPFDSLLTPAEKAKVAMARRKAVERPG